MNKTILILSLALILAGLFVTCIPTAKEYSLKLPLDYSDLSAIHYSQIEIVASGSLYAASSYAQGPLIYAGFIEYSPFTTYVCNGTILNPSWDNDGGRFRSGETLLFIAGGDFESWPASWNYTSRTLTTYAFTWTVPKYTFTTSLIQEWLSLGFPTNHHVPNLWKKTNVTWTKQGFDTFITLEAHG